jgi:hypothetical protein
MIVREKLAFTLREVDREAGAQILDELLFTSEQAGAFSRSPMRCGALNRMLLSLSSSSARNCVPPHRVIRLASTQSGEAAETRRPPASPGSGFIYAGPPRGSGSARKLFETARTGDIDPRCSKRLSGVS